MATHFNSAISLVYAKLQQGKYSNQSTFAKVAFQS